MIEGTRAAVLDASALLAWLREEPGAEAVEDRLPASFVSAVNLSEVLQRSLSEGVEVSGMAQDLAALGISFVGFDAEQAFVAARMWRRTRASARPTGRAWRRPWGSGSRRSRPTGPGKRSSGRACRWR